MAGGVNLTQLSPVNGSEEPVECTNDYCIPDDEYVDMILAYVFPRPSEWFLIGAYAVVFFAGLVGNGLVCFAVWRNHSMRTVTNYFIVNLAVADFLVIIICLPPTVVGDVTETWYLGRAMCKIVKYLQGVTISVSVLTLMCISVERWYAICYPLRFNSTPSRARLTIVVIWVVSTSIVVPELVFLDIHPPSGFSPDLTILLTSCRPTWHYQAAYQLFLIVAMYVLPFALMFVAYIQIARCLWSNPLFKAPGETGSTPRSRSDERADVQLQERRKVAKMLIAVVVMFGIFYLPVHVLNISRYANLLKNTGNGAIYFALVAHWLCYFSSAINPVIYNFMSAKFRREFRKACSCCLCACCRRRQTSRQEMRPRYLYRYVNNVTPRDRHMNMTTPRVS